MNKEKRFGLVHGCRGSSLDCVALFVSDIWMVMAGSMWQKKLLMARKEKERGKSLASLSFHQGLAYGIFHGFPW